EHPLKKIAALDRSTEAKLGIPLARHRSVILVKRSTYRKLERLPTKGNRCLHIDAYHIVIPAKAGTQSERRAGGPWVPAFAGMTKEEWDTESHLRSSRFRFVAK
ncbi:MAG TPA: hypothetical protein VGP50_05810, partial [Stellaceae bacterium]|nr:hypothetical protein [Stellaceae bacterium]